MRTPSVARRDAPAAGPAAGRSRSPLPAWAPTAVLAALLLSALVLPLWSELHKIGGGQEEGFMLAVPDLVLDGKVPHRDFAWLYGPGSAWMPALAYWLFGSDLQTGRMVGLAFHVTTVAAIFLLGLRWNRRAAAAAALVAVVFLTTRGLTPLPWDGALALATAALACAARALGEPSGRARAPAAFAAGLLGGLAVVARADFALGVLPAAVIAGGALRGASRRAGLAGLGAGLFPWAVHLAVAGPAAVGRGLFLDPLELRASNRLPVPPDPGEVAGFIDRFIDFQPPGWPLPRLTTAAQLTAWFFLLTAALLLAVWIAAAALRAGATPRARLLAALAVLAVGLVPGVLQRADASHLSSYSPLVLPAAIYAAAERSSRRPGGGGRGHPGSVAGAAALAATGLLVPTFGLAAYADDVLAGFRPRDDAAASVAHRGREFFVPRAQAAEVRGVLARVEEVTDPGDRLFVGPVDLRRTVYADSYFYFLLPHLVPATEFVYLNPAVALHHSERLARDVASADVLVLSDQWSAWDEPNDSRRFGPGTANEVVRRDFCAVGREGGLFRVLARCPPPAPG